MTAAEHGGGRAPERSPAAPCSDAPGPADFSPPRHSDISVPAGHRRYAGGVKDVSAVRSDTWILHPFCVLAPLLQVPTYSGMKKPAKLHAPVLAAGGIVVRETPE